MSSREGRRPQSAHAPALVDEKRTEGRKGKAQENQKKKDQEQNRPKTKKKKKFEKRCIQRRRFASAACSFVRPRLRAVMVSSDCST